MSTPGWATQSNQWYYSLPCGAQIKSTIQIKQKNKRDGAEPRSYIHGIKLIIMTKKEIKSAINKAVYMYAESLGYQVSDDGDGSYVTFYKDGTSRADDTIDYHRSYQETCVLNWASDEVKADADLIDAFAKNQMKQYN